MSPVMLAPKAVDLEGPLAGTLNLMDLDLATRLSEAGLVTRAQMSKARASLSEASQTSSMIEASDACLAGILVEQGLSEDALAGFFVAEGYGPLLDSDDLGSRQRALSSLISTDTSRRLSALPLRQSSAGWVVAMTAPSDPLALNELSRALGGQVLPMVIRVSDLLEGLLELPSLSSRPPSEIPQASTSGNAEGQVQAQAQVQPEQPRKQESEPAVLELVTRKPSRTPVPATEQEEEPVSLHRRRDKPAVSAPAEPDAFVPLVRAKPPRQHPANGGDENPFKKSQITQSFERPNLAKRKRELRVGEPQSPPLGISEQLLAEGEGLSDGGLEDRWDVPERAPSDKPIAPISLDSPRSPPSTLGPIRLFLVEMDAATARDQVVTIACEAAQTLGRSALLLALRSGVLKGWEGAGSGVSTTAVRNLWIPTNTPSVFHDVVGQQLAYRGPHGSTAADSLFRTAVNSRGGELGIEPVLIGAKVVAVLAVDDLDPSKESSTSLAVLARALGGRLERIVRQSHA